MPTPPEIHHCDFRELPLAADSVGLVFTDPPYQRKDLPLYEAMGEWASRVLKPGGVLACYSGKYYLPEVYTALSRHLTYRHTCALAFPANAHCRQWAHYGAGSVLYLTGWRPLLIYSKGPWRPWKLLKDRIESPKREKNLHKWQQPLTDALYYVERLTKSGDLVVDPFGGSFTTGLAAVLLGQRFVGCDINPYAVEIGRKRLSV